MIDNIYMAPFQEDQKDFFCKKKKKGELCF